MDYDEHVAAADREAAALEAAARLAPPTAEVPGCDGWTVGELTHHVGDFMGLWCHVLCEGSGRPKPPIASWSEDLDIGAWLHENRLRLVEELTATPPDTQVWSWAEGEDHARFVARRCAHELAIHRFDVQGAAGDPQPIDRALAMDGIDELADLTANPVNDRFGTGETLHAHATHGEGEWSFAMEPNGFVWSREHAKGDLALRGAASDLELTLYGRSPLGAVEQFGDGAVLDVWLRVWPFA